MSYNIDKKIKRKKKHKTYPYTNIKVSKSYFDEINSENCSIII